MNQISALPMVGIWRRVVIWAIAIIIVTRLCDMPAGADDFAWVDGASGLFSAASRWTPEGGPPNVGDLALFSVPGTYTVSGGGTVSVLQVVGGNVTFTGSISTDSQANGQALLFGGGEAHVSGSISSPQSMAVTGGGTLRLFGGGAVQATDTPAFNGVAVQTAAQVGSSGTVIIENTGSRLTANGGLNLAGAGTSTMQVRAGGELVASGILASNTPGIKIAVEASGNGTLLVDGINARVINTLQMNVGQLGHGVFTVRNGGQIDTSGNASLPAMVMGFGASGTGIGYVEDGGRLNTTGQFVIGGGGSAEFYLEAGGTVTSNAISTFAAVFVANAATSDGTARVNGGAWDVNGDFFLGGQGHGQVMVETGAILDIASANSLLTIGVQNGGLGELFVNGGQLLRPNTTTAITVGLGGRGRMEIHDGSDVVDSKLRVAQITTTAPEPSEVIVEGAGSTLTLKDELDVGMEDGGQLRVQNGAVVSVTAANSFAQAGAAATGHGEFIVTGDNSLLDVAGTMTLGRAGRGDLGIGVNGRVESGTATLGLLANSEGNANIESGGVWNVGGDLVVGDHGTGYVYLRQDGTIALQTGKKIILGLNTDGIGTLNIFGNGLLDIDTEVVVGQNGTGIFALHDVATYDTLGNFLLGDLSTARGEVHVNTGSTLTVHGDLSVGVAGEGLVTVDPTSTLNVNGVSLAIGLIDGAVGEVVVDGGRLLRPAAGITTIGFGGHGRLEVRGGADVSDGNVRVAQVPSSSVLPSELIVDGAGTSLALSHSLDLGIEDDGNLSVTNGAQMDVGDAIVAGTGATGVGSLLVTGTGSKIDVVGPLILAWSGRGFGGVELNGNLESGQGTIGREAGAEGSMDISSGGTWTVQGDLTVGEVGRGFVYLRQGGTLSVQTGSQIILGRSPGSSGILNIYANGSLDVDSDVVIGLEGAGAMNLFDGAIHNSMGSIGLGAIDGASGNISVNSGSSFAINGDLTIAEVFNATGGVDVNGPGSALQATNIYVGGSPTDVGGLAVANVSDQGHVFVANNLKLWSLGTVNVTGGGVTVGTSAPTAAAGAVRVNFQGKLSGSGVINGCVLNAGGVVAPGNSPGTLTVNGAFTQSTASSSLEIDLAGREPGMTHDVLAVQGAVSLTGDLTVNLLNGFNPLPNDVFQIITATGGVTGKFTSGSLPLLTGRNWQLEYATSNVALRVVITGDYNRNGTVDAADYPIWRDSLNQTGFALAADGNRDGVINEFDRAVWQAHFGQTAAGGASASVKVPEPVSYAVFIVPTAVFTVRSPRRISPRKLQ